MTDTTAKTIPGSKVEIINDNIERGRVRFALFDFDGTISLIREGWPEVMIPMMVDILKAKSTTDETEEQLEAIIRNFVEELTGKQTIFQCMALCDAIKERGGEPEEPLVYKHQYLDLLMERIKHRLDGLRSGEIPPVKYQVPGSLDLLEAFKARGVKMYLASGTDEPFVIDEAKTLGVSEYFDGIYGARDDYKAFSKAKVIERIIQENELKGPELVGFGDGYVEIENVKSVGGIAVAVATDEKKCLTCEPWKRQRLTRAGADFMIPSFVDWEPLIKHLFNES